MNLGSAIAQCRQLKGLTKTELAERCQLSVSYLSLIEHNKREPNISVIDKIASAIGIPVSLLVFIASDDEETSSLSTELRDELNHITREMLSEETSLLP